MQMNRMGRPLSPSQSYRKINLSILDLGSAHNQGLLKTVPCRATWSLSSVDQESTHAVSGGKPSVDQTLQALPPIHQ